MALLTFKQGVIDPSNRLSNWSSQQDCCAWHGVSCNEQDRVFRLDLPNERQNNSESTLRGTINLPSLLQLQFLEYLDLSYNDFEGISLPSAAVSDSNLVRLDLSFNSRLHIHNLHWLSPLSSLESLYLSGIDLHDQTNWTHSLSSLPFLSDLSLNDCNLTNLNPYDKNVNLSSLSFLDLAENNFNTQLPYWLFNLSNELWSLNLRNCNFIGQIPDWLGKYNSLQYLHLSHNLFHGSIPSNLANSSSLQVLDISFNDLSGGLPHLSIEVEILDLAHNSFSGSLSPLLCQSEHNSRLAYLDISSNLLTGELSDCWNNWKALSHIFLGSNKLLGEIPPTLGSLPSLESLDLHDNDLYGHIPRSFQNSSTLVSRENSSRHLRFVFSESSKLVIQQFQRAKPEKQNQKQLEEGYEVEYFWKSLYVGMGVGFAVGFWMVSGSIFFIRTWRHRFFRWFDGVVDRIYVIVALKFRSLH
ncbi:receptor-like protein EIX2 [Senna tora]|uniref:Receptor-like protein EIX2 n=1 Tax=Senna tora TaxID=362788 RepID=A0A834WG06_9FABA|nr:receptor-like protein EIX2 [Senna tora]